MTNISDNKFYDKDFILELNFQDSRLNTTIIDFIDAFYIAIKQPFLRFKYLTSDGIKRYDLSSGEKALLSMYSRFYGALKTIYSSNEKEKHNKVQNILILMDEPELYLHPSWQRLFIQNIICFFENIFKEQNYKFQIIMTSNTPFLVSDLPKENIIFFKNEEQCKAECNISCKGKCRVCKKTEFNQTFGANIHTLLTNSFFMDSTIGQFALEKINTTITDLSNINDNLRKIKNHKLDMPQNEEIYFIINYLKEKHEDQKNTVDNQLNVQEKKHIAFEQCIERLHKSLHPIIVHHYEPLIEIIGEPLTQRVATNILGEIKATLRNFKTNEIKSIEDEIKYHKAMLETLEEDLQKSKGEGKK